MACVGLAWAEAVVMSKSILNNMANVMKPHLAASLELNGAKMG